MAYHTDIAACAKHIAVVAARGSLKLDPSEQVWQQLDDRSLANRCYDSYEHIVYISLRHRTNSPKSVCNSRAVHAQPGKSASEQGMS